MRGQNTIQEYERLVQDHLNPHSKYGIQSDNKLLLKFIFDFSECPLQMTGLVFVKFLSTGAKAQKKQNYRDDGLQLLILSQLKLSCNTPQEIAGYELSL